MELMSLYLEVIFWFCLPVQSMHSPCANNCACWKSTSTFSRNNSLCILFCQCPSRRNILEAYFVQRIECEASSPRVTWQQLVASELSPIDTTETWRTHRELTVCLNSCMSHESINECFPKGEPCLFGYIAFELFHQVLLVHNCFMRKRPRPHFRIERGIISRSHLQNSFDMFVASQTQPPEEQFPLQFFCISMVPF